MTTLDQLKTQMKLMGGWKDSKHKVLIEKILTKIHGIPNFDNYQYVVTGAQIFESSGIQLPVMTIGERANRKFTSKVLNLLVN